MVGEATYALPVGDVIDLKAEGARLQKEIKKLADEIGKIDAKLGNAAFVSRAPEEVVEEQRERRSQAEQTRTAQHGAGTAGGLGFAPSRWDGRCAARDLTAGVRRYQFDDVLADASSTAQHAASQTLGSSR